jgi:hypothetical protein
VCIGASPFLSTYEYVSESESRYICVIVCAYSVECVFLCVCRCVSLFMSVSVCDLLCKCVCRCVSACVQGCMYMNDFV